MLSQIFAIIRRFSFNVSLHCLPTDTNIKRDVSNIMQTRHVSRYNIAHTNIFFLPYRSCCSYVPLVYCRYSITALMHC